MLCQNILRSFLSIGKSEKDFVHGKVYKDICVLECSGSIVLDQIEESWFRAKGLSIKLLK